MTQHDTMLSPMAELSQNVAQPFERARAMPKSVYTSEAFLQAELDHVFKQDWFCVTRADALAKPGDYTTLDLAGQPIMVIRDRDGQLAGAIQRLPAPHVDTAGRLGQHAQHRLPLSRLDLQP